MGDKKISRLKHFQQVEKSTGKKPKALKLPPLRSELRYLWETFVDIHNATGGSITYQELQAYCYFNVKLTPFEIDAIRTLSNLSQRARYE